MNDYINDSKGAAAMLRQLDGIIGGLRDSKDSRNDLQAHESAISETISPMQRVQKLNQVASQGSQVCADELGGTAAITPVDQAD